MVVVVVLVAPNYRISSRVLLAIIHIHIIHYDCCSQCFSELFMASFSVFIYVSYCKQQGAGGGAETTHHYVRRNQLYETFFTKIKISN